ncbi:MAG TPA: hypothetical protein VIM12_05690 [Noviherbaspirillum sp.]|jgi:hypothetical protein|uniref:hypothetical protein n=1 Tax=Noviherbaspirillum sp. TaxID=1926288 RepID=UPI002F93218D
MESLYDDALEKMEKTLESFSASVPPPTMVSTPMGLAVRYREKTLQQAIILKLVRILSGVHAMRLLIMNGFVQEQAVLQRVQDEFDEDVLLLVLGAVRGETKLHEEYLAGFWEEEFDKATALESSQRRPMVPRKRIRAYIAEQLHGSSGVDRRQLVELNRTLYTSYSGYVHGGAPHILDMYGGNPPRFHVRGMAGTRRHREHRDDLWNYVYRAILSFAFAAAAFEREQMRLGIAQYADAFAKSAGRSYF